MKGSRRNEVAFYPATITKPDELSVAATNRIEKIKIVIKLKNN